MIALRRAGLSFEKIAAALKRSSSTVYDYLEPFESTVDEARATLEASASKAAQAWDVALIVGAEQGNHKPAKDLLEAVGVVKPQVETAIGVIVNMPGAALPQELIDLPTGESAGPTPDQP